MPYVDGSPLVGEVQVQDIRRNMEKVCCLIVRGERRSTPFCILSLSTRLQCAVASFLTCKKYTTELGIAVGGDGVMTCEFFLAHDCYFNTIELRW